MTTLCIEIDAVGARRTRGDTVVESIDWNELGEVAVVTTDAGPFAEDVFYMFSAVDGGHGCVIPTALTMAGSSASCRHCPASTTKPSSKP